MLVFDYKDTEHKFFAENIFQSYDIKFFRQSLNPETFNKLSEQEKNQTSIISIFSDSILTEDIIDGFNNLRTIAIRSSNYDNINKKMCNKRNIAVLNVPSYGKTATAEFTFGLIINLVRQIPQAIKSVRDKTFSDKSFIGYELKNMTIGVIGTGEIGAEVCRIASAFGMKILAYDIKPKTELIDKYNIKYFSLEEILKNSDIITLHLPYTGINYHMLSKHQFEILKDGSYFINTSRGELVDTLYLKESLTSGKIRGAALDFVACQHAQTQCRKFAQQLDGSSLQCLIDSDLVRDLSKMENVIITPEIASDTKDAINHVLNEMFYALQDQIIGGNTNRVI